MVCGYNKRRPYKEFSLIGLNISQSSPMLDTNVVELVADPGNKIHAIMVNILNKVVIEKSSESHRICQTHISLQKFCVI